MRRFFEMSDAEDSMTEGRGPLEIAAQAVVSSVGKWTPAKIEAAVTDAVRRFGVDRVDLEEEVERMIGDRP